MSRRARLPLQRRTGGRMLAPWRAAMVVTAALAATPAHADTVADFYKGKQINLIVGYGPGGGYDTYARLLARHFGRFVPGNPNVIVQNMPGAGSLRAVNYLYNVAPKDGATIGTFSRNMPLIGLLGGNSNVQFNPRKFTWLGSTSSFVNDAYILIVRKDAPVKSMKPEWLKLDSGFRVLVQFARATRHPDFPDVPTARELAKNEAARALIELAELPYALSRPFAAPPNLPAERAKALQRAFLAVHGDPEYLEDAARLSLDVSPIGADDILHAIDRIAVAPPELLDYVRRLLAETRGGGQA